MLKARIKWEGDIHVIDRQGKESVCVCVMIEIDERRPNFCDGG